MPSAAENELLTRSGAGTPTGEYFRRFWQPVALSRELPEPDGAPIRVKVLGEELFFGRNEEGGLRCVYHGWKYDVHGKCIELPNVPPGSAYHDKISDRSPSSPNT